MSSKKPIKIIPKVNTKESKNAICADVSFCINLDWNSHVSDQSEFYSKFIKNNSSFDQDQLIYDAVILYVEKSIFSKIDLLKIPGCKFSYLNVDSIDISDECIKIFDEYNFDPDAKKQEKEYRKQQILDQIKKLTDELYKIENTKE